MSKKVKWVAALAIPIMYVAYACTQKDPQGMVMLWASFWEVCALSAIMSFAYTKNFLGRRTVVTRLYEVGIAEIRMLSDIAKRIGKTVYVDINGKEYRIPK